MDHSHGGHRQRMRERILANGAETLQPHEIVEFLLYYAIPRRDLNPLAHALLAHFGTLQQLFSATAEELMQVDGISASTANLLHCIGAAVLEYARPASPPVVLNNRSETRQYLLEFFPDDPEDCCWILYLNINGHLIHVLQLDHREDWFSVRNMRRTMSEALSCHAHSLLLAHRQEAYRISGADIQHVQQLTRALKNIDIDLLEYIVMNRDKKRFLYYTNPALENAQIKLAESPLMAHWLDKP